jgi:hypothetical protein
MSQKSIAKWIQGILIGFAICGVVLYAGIIPMIGKDMVYDYPEFGYMFLPWLIFLLLTAIPCYIFLFYGWKISVNIDNDRSFCEDNAQHLKKMAYLALGDTVFFLLGNIVYLFLGMNHPGILLGSFLIDFVGVAFSVGCAALSHLVKKASDLQTENDLTI